MVASNLTIGSEMTSDPFRRHLVEGHTPLHRIGRKGWRPQPGRHPEGTGLDGNSSWSGMSMEKPVHHHGRETTGNIKALFARAALYQSIRILPEPLCTGSLPLPFPPVAEPLAGYDCWKARVVACTNACVVDPDAGERP